MNFIIEEDFWSGVGEKEDQDIISLIKLDLIESYLGIPYAFKDEDDFVAKANAAILARYAASAEYSE